MNNEERRIVQAEAAMDGAPEQQRSVSDRIREYQLQTMGTSAYHRFGIMPNVVCTDGVMFVAKEAQAFWLIDAIATHQLDNRVGSEPFQAWKLLPGTGDRAMLVCEDGNGRVLTRQHFDYTTFPRDLLPFDVWIEFTTLQTSRGMQRTAVLMLPAER